MAMDILTLDAQPRGTGTRNARAIRREGRVPCVLYGPHVEPVHFQVPVLSLYPLIYTTETHRVTVQVDGDQWDCILKEMEYHPVTDQPIHADFQVLQKGEKITLTVPVRFHGTPVGQADEGGDVQYAVHDLEVTCLPDDIPSYIDVDISALHIGDSIHVSDLDVPNVEFSAEPEQTLVTVVPPRLEEEPEVALEEELPEGAAAEGLEGAPEEEAAEAGEEKEEEE